MAKIKKEVLKEQIIESKGIYSHIAFKLKICRQTVAKYIKEYDLEDFAYSQKESVKDKVRTNIYNWIAEGNEKVTLWFAERQMFEEYGNKQKIEHDTTKHDERTDEEIEAENKRLSKIGL